MGDTRMPPHDTNSQYLGKLHNVTKVYQQGSVQVEALRKINLVLQRQKFIFIVGPSGSGKTTLLNLLGCIDVPTSGRFTLLDKEIGTLTDNELADFRNLHIGYIFQNFNLMAVLSAYENVEYPLILQNIPKKKRDARVSEILDAVGLTNRQHHRPAQLSGGEQQRVAVARALVKRSDLILADEPTANLDSRTSHEIIELMLTMQMQYKTSFIFSTHDTEVMHHADEIISIKDGQVEKVSRGGKLA